MRIYGPNGTTPTGGASSSRRTQTGSFSLDAEEPTRATTSTSAPRSLGGIDALMALQGLDDLPERRRRGVKRGRQALDALDALKLGFLAGSLDQSALLRLKSAAASLTERSGDPGLDSVLAEIELRVEVELAKFGVGSEAGK